MIFSISCAEDPTASIYDVIEPSEKLPVERFYNFDEKTKKEIPYGITVDAQGTVYVSLSGLGIKKITGDSLTIFAPKGPETFFKAMTFGSDGAIYAVRGGIKGIYKIVENTAPAAFVASAQGIADNINDVEYASALDVFWAGGSTGILYRITPTKNIKRFTELAGNVNAIKYGNNNLYVALRDTNNQETIWKFPVLSSDSLGNGQMLLNFSQKIDSIAKITDIAVAEDGDVILCTNDKSIALYTLHPNLSFEELYNGLISGSIYSFVWGQNNLGYFTNILVDVNTDIYKIDLKKNKAQ